jgi:hypothetical protein
VPGAGGNGDGISGVLILVVPSVEARFPPPAPVELSGFALPRMPGAGVAEVVGRLLPGASELPGLGGWVTCLRASMFGRASERKMAGR